MERNAPGQHHADRFVALRGDGTAKLRYLSGKPTGQAVGWWQLTYNDGGVDGWLRLDHHELVSGRGEDGRDHRCVFFRAGLGLQDPTIPYGHVWLTDVSPPGPTVASGDGRGRAATLTGDRYRVAVTSMPPGAVYKRGHPGSMYQTYAWPQARWGDMNALKTVPLCWSWINVGGGGMVRGMLPDRATVDTCKVAPVHSPMYDSDFGAVIGEVSARYVRAYGKYGWLLAGHRLTGEDWTYHIEEA